MHNAPPKHIAVIMDGNGRWAKQKKLSRVAGHREGTKATKRIVKACGELGVKYLTVYVFSSENWRRPRIEVNALMGLLIEKIHDEIEELHQEHVRLRAIGNLAKLPAKTRTELEAGMEKTSQNKGLQMILALSYGGREEIVEACRGFSRDVLAGKVHPDKISEKMFRTYTYLPEIPDPELLIRTGGEQRVSNFLLWQIAYSEFYITPTLWPDFDKPELIRAIETFQNRQRRFGKVLDK